MYVVKRLQDFIVEIPSDLSALVSTLLSDTLRCGFQRLFLLHQLQANGPKAKSVGEDLMPEGQWDDECEEGPSSVPEMELTKQDSR
jgi:hypothetical protein